MAKTSNKSNNITKQIWSGEVVSNKSDKTIVVRVNRVKIHPVYKKRITLSKKYQVHDPENRFQIGDQVSFVECRPLSKLKRWQVVYL